jgi:hypothetical protein
VRLSIHLMLSTEQTTVFASGYVVPIARVRERDLVRCYRGGTGKIGSADIVKKEAGQVARVYRITTRDGGHLECSEETRILRWSPKGRRFAQVSKLNTGDTLPRFVEGSPTLTMVSAIEHEDRPILVPMENLRLFSSTDGLLIEGFIVRG